jgi:putative methionine-R-sulfoxide reductase with GAF domain
MPRSPVGPRKAAAERLRDIESVIDSRLARLDVEDLLDELLDRVRDALHADTAAVLLLDEPTGQLVATAARGIEAEVRQGVRIPLGRGFAGRIAATRLPVTVEDIEVADVINPLLRESGIRSLLGVPLLAGGRLLGVLHVGTLAPRRFTDADVELLQVVAERVALATHARVSDIERTAARILQRSLLPELLPDVEGLETAFRYIAGGEGDVGGDWYDLFVLPSGWVCVTVGDVVGRGLRAGAVMGRMRNAVRAYALEADGDGGGGGGGGDPAAILERVDRMVQHFQPGEMATVAVGLLEPSLDRLHLSTAGHPSPVLAAGDGPGTYLDLAIDPPIGAVEGVRRRTVAIDVAPGAVLCFYTDGLIERRDVPLNVRVRQLTEAVAAGPADQVCARVMGALIGPETSSDDVAILVVRRLTA